MKEHLQCFNTHHHMKKAILLFTILVLPMLATAIQPAEKQEIYIQLYSIRDAVKQDFHGSVKKLAAIGFTGIEAAGYSDGLFYGMKPADFRKAIEATGMKVLSSHTHRRLDENPSSTDWKAVWSWWDQAIKAHKEAGMSYLIVPWMPVPKTLADLKIYCDYYNEIGRRCNEAGIRFGYHNHSFEFQEIEGQLMYDYMLKNTEPSKVFFQMDVYWVVRGGHSPVEYFKTNPGRFEQLHLKDHKELGQSGMVGFDAILNSLQIAGVKKMIVEVEKYSMDPMESVRVSYEYLKSIPPTVRANQSARRRF